MCKIASLFTVQQNQFATQSFVSLLNKQNNHLNMQWELEWILISSSRLCQHSVDIIYTMTQALNTCSSVHLGRNKEEEKCKECWAQGAPPITSVYDGDAFRTGLFTREIKSHGGGIGGPYFRGVNHHELFFPLGNTPSLTSPPTHTQTLKNKNTDLHAYLDRPAALHSVEIPTMLSER